MNFQSDPKQWRIQDFPLGGADPLGGANLRCIHFSAKTYVKMKEIDPVGGGGGGAHAVAPPWIHQCKGKCEQIYKPRFVNQMWCESILPVQTQNVR